MSRSLPRPLKSLLAATAVALAFQAMAFQASGQATAADPFWPCFHGAAGDNISTDTGLLSQWPEGGPELLWTAKDLGMGYSSVSLAHGLIYTAGNIDDQSVVTALDLSGKQVWQTKCGDGWKRSYPGTRSTPTIDGDRLYFETPLGDVVCLNAKDGEHIWSRDILNAFDGKNITWALAESVLIDGDLAICAPFGDTASVVALNKEDGNTVWAAESVGEKAGYATPTIAEVAGKRMVLTMSGKALVGVDIANGDLLFRYEHITKHDVNALKPVAIGDMIFISSGYGSGSEMVKVTSSDGKFSAEQAWASKDMDNHHGGVIVHDGYIYGSDSRRAWVCFDWKTGETKYKEKGVGKGSLTMADGLLYTLSERDGTVGLVKPTPNGHDLISEFTIPEGGAGAVWAHPVVCGGRLYVRHAEFLYVFKVK